MAIWWPKVKVWLCIITLWHWHPSIEICLPNMSIHNLWVLKVFLYVECRLGVIKEAYLRSFIIRRYQTFTCIWHIWTARNWREHLSGSSVKIRNENCKWVFGPYLFILARFWRKHIDSLIHSVGRLVLKFVQSDFNGIFFSVEILCGLCLVSGLFFHTFYH